MYVCVCVCSMASEVMKLKQCMAWVRDKVIPNQREKKQLGQWWNSTRGFNGNEVVMGVQEVGDNEGWLRVQGLVAKVARGQETRRENVTKS